MPRTLLTDEQWLKLKPILLDCRIYDKPNLRNNIEGILYKLRAGCTWRDVPGYFGKWNSLYKNFNNWCRDQKLFIAFKIASKDCDLEWIFMDGSIVSAHQQAMGAAKKSEEGDHGIGKSVQGNSTKIHMAVDSMGNPIDFEITGGEVHDVNIAPILVDRLPKSEFTIADKGYDSEDLREKIKNKKSIPIIPKKKNSKTGNKDLDWDLYKLRHLIENTFARLKHFRSIATRFDKLGRNYKGMLSMACLFLWLPL
jgi:transposase